MTKSPRPQKPLDSNLIKHYWDSNERERDPTLQASKLPTVIVLLPVTTGHPQISLDQVLTGKSWFWWQERGAIQYEPGGFIVFLHVYSDQTLVGKPVAVKIIF